jgi:hypothetical protein
MAGDGTIMFLFKTKSLNLPCGIYTRLCLYLSNPSTNLTPLSVLPLQSLRRNICASGFLVYPLTYDASRIYLCTLATSFDTCSFLGILLVYLMWEHANTKSSGLAFFNA